VLDVALLHNARELVHLKADHILGITLLHVLALVECAASDRRMGDDHHPQIGVDGLHQELLVASSRPVTRLLDVLVREVTLADEVLRNLKNTGHERRHLVLNLQILID